MHPAARFRLYYAALVAGLGAVLMAAVPLAARADACPQTYVVQPGDWLSKVAGRCGVSMAEIRALNPDLNPNRIEIGQQIVLREPEVVEPVLAGVRIPMAGMPPAPPMKGRVAVTAEVVRDAGTCLYLADAEGRTYSFAAGQSDLEPGMWVTMTGEVVDNWFCRDGAEVLVDTVEPGAPTTEMATLTAATL